MRSVLLSFLIVGLLGVSGYADCGYFRVTAKLLKCGPADARTMAEIDPYQAVPEAPELEDLSKRALMQVKCECEYSLQGSDPRCDIDQTVEKSSVMEADDDPSHSCRRGNSLCRDVCPPTLP